MINVWYPLVESKFLKDEKGFYLEANKIKRNILNAYIF